MKNLIRKIIREELEDKKFRLAKRIVREFLNKRIEQLSEPENHLELGFKGKMVIKCINYNPDKLSLNYHFIENLTKMLDIEELVSPEELFSIIIDWVNDNYGTSAGPNSWEWFL